MFKVICGRKQEKGVWKQLDYDTSTDKSEYKVQDCSVSIKGKKAGRTLQAARLSNVEDELMAFLSASKSYSDHSGLNFWIKSEQTFPLLAPIA
jgi:hypothetical protein